MLGSSSYARGLPGCCVRDINADCWDGKCCWLASHCQQTYHRCNRSRDVFYAIVRFWTYCDHDLGTSKFVCVLRPTQPREILATAVKTNPRGLPQASPLLTPIGAEVHSAHIIFRVLPPIDSGNKVCCINANSCVSFLPCSVVMPYKMKLYI